MRAGSLAQWARSVTEVPLELTPLDREAMARGDLPLSRLREIAGPPVRYVVRSEQQVRGPLSTHLDAGGYAGGAWGALTLARLTEQP